MTHKVFQLISLSVLSLVLACTGPEPSPTPISVPSPTPTTLIPTAAPVVTEAFQPPDQPLRSMRMIVTDNALWAGHPASRTVIRLSLPNGQQMWQIGVGCEPATMAYLKPRLFVACFDSGELLVLDAQSGDVLSRNAIGHGPFGVLVVADRLYVTLAHENPLLTLRTVSR